MSEAVLLSGGMDSIALTYWRHPHVALTIDYGQVCAEAEKRAARAVCDAIGIRHEIITVDARSLGCGDLADSTSVSVAPSRDWWPFRNQLLVTLAAMRALHIGVTTLVVGSVVSDRTHIDGSPEFYRALDALVASQEGGIRVHAPASQLTTVELVRQSGIPGELLAWAHSCHRANYACATCRGCYKHRMVMNELGFGEY